MQATRRELIDEFVASVGEPGDSRVRNLAETLLNTSLERVWLKGVTWRQFILPTPYAFSTVANVRHVALPSFFGRITSRDGAIRNATTGRTIWPTDPEQLTADSPKVGTDLETAGPPRYFYIDGSWGVHTQPASAGEALEVLSDSTDDVTVRAFIEGRNADGEWVQNQVTLNGSTPVAIGTFSFVQDFGKAYPDGITPTTEFTSSAGTVRLRTVADATVLQTLDPFTSAQEHQVLTLVPVPDAAYSIVVPFMRRPRRMVRDADPCPMFWKAAILEDMLIHWNAKGLPVDNGAPRPALADLIAYENLSRPPLTQRPFMG